jgi:hypothetical protein
LKFSFSLSLYSEYSTHAKQDAYLSRGYKSGIVYYKREKVVNIVKESAGCYVVQINTNNAETVNSFIDSEVEMS